MKFPLIPITLFFALGIVFNFYWQFPLHWSIGFLMAAVLLFGLSFWHAKKQLLQQNFFGITTYIVSFSIGMLTNALHCEPSYENHYSHFIAESNILQGTISERLKPNLYSEKYYFKISQINGKEVFGKVLLNVPKKETTKLFHAGDELLVKTDLRIVPTLFNPFQFDYAAYLEKHNVFHQMHLKSDNYYRIGRQHNFDYYTENYRNALLNSFAIHNFSPETENIIKALLLGQRQDMDQATASHYTDAGVVHILAISGLHIAILYGILLILLKPLYRFAYGKLLQFVIILGFLWVFAILAGLSASVVRSVVMFSFMSLGAYLNKSGNIYNTLAVSMLAILLFNPNSLFDVGFQMSYLAVFAIVWLQPFYKSVKISKYGFINYFVDTVMISLAAQLGVLPLSLYYFNQLPLLFLLANVVVIPLSSFVLLLGIVILLFNFILPKAALLLGKLLSYSIEIMNDYIAWIASFDRFVIKDIPFSFALLLLSYMLLSAFVFWLYEKQAKRLLLFLSACLFMQIAMLSTISQAKQGSEFIIFNNRHSTLIAEKDADQISIFSNDSLVGENSSLKAYHRGNFNLKMEMHALANALVYKDQKIFIIDSMGIYKIGNKVDIILLTQSTKVNLTRLIRELQPKKIIADGTNYKSYVRRWEATCVNEKIPFHATAEKGFYKITN